jgi:hypothetical protein
LRITHPADEAVEDSPPKDALGYSEISADAADSDIAITAADVRANEQQGPIKRPGAADQQSDVVSPSASEVIAASAPPLSAIRALADSLLLPSKTQRAEDSERHVADHVYDSFAARTSSVTDAYTFNRDNSDGLQGEDDMMRSAAGPITLASAAVASNPSVQRQRSLPRVTGPSSAEAQQQPAPAKSEFTVEDALPGNLHGKKHDNGEVGAPTDTHPDQVLLLATMPGRNLQEI